MSYRRKEIFVCCCFCGCLFEPSERVKYDMRKNPNKKRYCSSRCQSFSNNRLNIKFKTGSPEYHKEKRLLNIDHYKKKQKETYKKNREEILLKRANKKYGEYGSAYRELRKLEAKLKEENHET